MLAATNLGIYQSLDSGKTWTFHLGGLPKGEVKSVIFHPLRHGEAYALYHDWIYRSTDGGLDWSPFDRTGLGNVTFRTIAFDLSDMNPQLYGLSPLRGVFTYHTPAPQPTTNVPTRPHTALN